MRIVLCIEYEGTNYTGWQAQNKSSKKTVQYYLDKSISNVADSKITSICAGRTDTGVHAISQFIHFDTNKKRDEQNWIKGINSHLPNDIRVKKLYFVDESFHARYSAISRSYRYVIFNQKTNSAILSDFALWYDTDINIDKLKKSIQYIKGEHDFSCFRSSGCQAKTPIKIIKKANITTEKSLIIIDITANAFLYHMVRNIVGTLLDVNEGKLKPSDIATIIKSKDRKNAGKKVSPQGLYLMNVEYPKHYKISVTKDFFHYV